MTTVLETRELRKEFGALLAVDDVSVAVESDAVTSIIGPNGAGKTTFYNLLAGQLRPTAGEIFLRSDGRLDRITGLPRHEIARRGLSRAFQLNNSFDGLTVLDNLRAARVSAEGRSLEVGTRVAGDDGLRERAWEVLERTDLTEVAEMECRNLSHGDKRKVEIALALATDPTVVLLDEPTAGMTPSESERMVDLVRKLNETTDITFVLTEHDIEMVLGISDRVLVLHQGALIADGTPGEIMEDEQVASAYLGEEARR